MAEPSRASVFFQLLIGYRVSQALYVAAKLGVADHLKDGPRSGEEVARSVGAHAPSLARLLRALVGIGILAEREDGRFALTAVGECLRSDAPDSQRAVAIFYGDRRHWGAWGALLQSVTTGEKFGGPGKLDFTDLAARDPEGAAIFNDAMSAFTRGMDAAVTEAYDFSRIRTLVDVGGGHGALLAGILRAQPHLRGILFDIPPVIDGARAHVERAGLGSRIELVAGSFFEVVPPGGDAYMLKFIIHDWDDERSTQILQSCRRAMDANGKLLLVERVVPPLVEQIPAHREAVLADLNMLVLTGGRERTEAEYTSLLAKSGFRLERIVATASMVSVVEGVPAA